MVDDIDISKDEDGFTPINASIEEVKIDLPNIKIKQDSGSPKKDDRELLPKVETENNHYRRVEAVLKKE